MTAAAALALLQTNAAHAESCNWPTLGPRLARENRGAYIVCHRRAGVVALRRAGEALVHAATVDAGHSSIGIARLGRDAGV